MRGMGVKRVAAPGAPAAPLQPEAFLFEASRSLAMTAADIATT